MASFIQEENRCMFPTLNAADRKIYSSIFLGKAVFFSFFWGGGFFSPPGWIENVTKKTVPHILESFFFFSVVRISFYSQRGCAEYVTNKR